MTLRRKVAAVAFAADVAFAAASCALERHATLLPPTATADVAAAAARADVAAGGALALACRHCRCCYCFAGGLPRPK